MRATLRAPACLEFLGPRRTFTNSHIPDHSLCWNSTSRHDPLRTAGFSTTAPEAAATRPHSTAWVPRHPGRCQDERSGLAATGVHVSFCRIARGPKRQSETPGSEPRGARADGVVRALAAVVTARHGTRTRRNSRTSTDRPRKFRRAIVDRQGRSPALIGVIRLVRVPLHHHGHGRGNRRRGAWSDDHSPHVIDRGVLRPDKSEADVPSSRWQIQCHPTAR